MKSFVPLKDWSERAFQVVVPPADGPETTQKYNEIRSMFTELAERLDEEQDAFVEKQIEFYEQRYLQFIKDPENYVEQSNLEAFIFVFLIRWKEICDGISHTTGLESVAKTIFEGVQNFAHSIIIIAELANPHENSEN